MTTESGVQKKPSRSVVATESVSDKKTIKVRVFGLWLQGVSDKKTVKVSRLCRSRECWTKNRQVEQVVSGSRECQTKNSQKKK